MEFEKACSEMSFILENLNPKDKEKVPKSVIDFFYKNRDIFYNVSIDLKKPLAEQNILEETRAFLYIIHYKYFANNVQKEEFKENILNRIQ